MIASNRSILVTGTSGMVGYAVATRLNELGFDVVGLDINQPTQALSFPFRLGSITDEALLDSLCSEHNINSVIHAGGYSGPMLSQDSPRTLFDVNIGGLINVLEAARKFSFNCVVNYSSILAYGIKADFTEIIESTDLTPDTLYGATKVAGEALLSAYASTYGINSVSLRPTGIYGPGRRTPCLIRTLIDHARSKTPVTINNSPEFRRQFIHIDDVVAASIKALFQSNSTAQSLSLNISDGKTNSVEHIVSIVQDFFPDLNVTYSYDTPLIGGFKIGPLSNEQADKILDWQPKIQLTDGIASYIRSIEGK